MLLLVLHRAWGLLTYLAFGLGGREPREAFPADLLDNQYLSVPDTSCCLGRGMLLSYQTWQHPLHKPTPKRGKGGEKRTEGAPWHDIRFKLYIEGLSLA